jgi:hypothetical protein
MPAEPQILSALEAAAGMCASAGLRDRRRAKILPFILAWARKSASRSGTAALAGFKLQAKGKKAAKTSTNRRPLYPERPEPKESQVFCFFFSKKKTFLPLAFAFRPGSVAITKRPRSNAAARRVANCAGV